MSLVKRRLRFHLFHTTNRMNQQNGLEKKTFISDMLKGLLSTSTTSVFYKTTVSRRAIAGGKNTELMTKESDK